MRYCLRHFFLRRSAQGLSDFGRQSKTSVRIFRGFGALPNKREADSLTDSERSEIVQKDIPFHCLQILRFGAPAPPLAGKLQVCWYCNTSYKIQMRKIGRKRMVVKIQLEN